MCVVCGTISFTLALFLLECVLKWAPTFECELNLSVKLF